MMQWRYITIEDVVQTHKMTLEYSGGGIAGARELERIDSVLMHIQNDDYYPTIESKLTHLFFSVCKFHVFLDGNKRLAINLCAQMMLINGFTLCARSFFIKAENVSYHVAAGRISKELLGEWISEIIWEQVESESLQLKILIAISDFEKNNSFE
jgi:death on curing protein